MQPAIVRAARPSSTITLQQVSTRLRVNFLYIRMNSRNGFHDPRAPKEKPGTTQEVMTLNVDLAPAILTTASISVPDVMRGRIILL